MISMYDVLPAKQSSLVSGLKLTAAALSVIAAAVLYRASQSTGSAEDRADEHREPLPNDDKSEVLAKPMRRRRGLPAGVLTDAQINAMSPTAIEGLVHVLLNNGDSDRVSILVENTDDARKTYLLQYRAELPNAMETARAEKAAQQQTSRQTRSPQP